MKIKISDQSGQSTVELAVMFPVVLIIACIAINATLCFSQCAKFDRLFKQTVCALCASPGYGQTIDRLNSEVRQSLESDFSANNVEIESHINSISGGYYEFSAEIKIRPTLFGLGLKNEIFGIPLYAMCHNQKLVIDIYKPGIIF